MTGFSFARRDGCSTWRSLSAFSISIHMHPWPRDTRASAAPAAWTSAPDKRSTRFGSSPSPSEQRNTCNCGPSNWCATRHCTFFTLSVACNSAAMNSPAVLGVAPVTGVAVSVIMAHPV